MPEIHRTAARRRNLCGNATPFAAHSSTPAAPSIVQPVHGAVACGRPIVAQPCAKLLVDPDPPPGQAAEEQKYRNREAINTIIKTTSIDIHRIRQSGPQPDPRLLRQTALEVLTRSARSDSPRKTRPEQNSGEVGRRRRERRREAAAHARVRFSVEFTSTCVTLNGSGIQLAVGPQPLWLRNHNSGPIQRIMVKRLATSPHDPLGITDSACKNQSVVVSVYIPIRSTTIGKSRVARDPIATHTSWRSNSDIVSVTSSGADAAVARTSPVERSRMIPGLDVADVGFDLGMRTVLNTGAELLCVLSCMRQHFSTSLEQGGGRTEEVAEKLHELGSRFSAELSFGSGNRVLLVRLAPTSFTGKMALQRLAAVVLRIRSMTGITTPSSVCTRRADEFTMNGISSSRWSEQVQQRQQRTAAGGGAAGAASGRRPSSVGEGGIGG
ncbi:putative RNA-binding protein 18 [Dorcoceras hygrometricum]|uniref:Putative RNA-binding protein 18 n=1 Tax=Dorcoceras hygrometricum TaxID=472368 RepID=A0A2Z7BQN6_9LAMI|nr:putative RNA-binding protein 18 [Dorcoceras hygrometricum]